jgi:hypothetical protein
MHIHPAFQLPTLAFLLSIGIGPFAARAGTLEDCDLIYSKRETLGTTAEEKSTDERLLRETLACLNGALNGATEVENERYDRIMVVLSALLQAKTSKTSEDLSVMKNAIEKWRSVGGTVGVLSYWSGVQLSFECDHLDRGKPLPTETVKNLKTLITRFEDASKLAPETHYAGPDRVLGILYGLENASGKSLPAMFGGDTKKAEGYLRKAYATAPKLSANALNFARILIKNGKRAEAEPILNLLKTRKEADWNPYPSTLRFPRPETRADIERAKKL